MSLDRRVPEQDSAQNEELTRRAKEKRDKENYEAAVKENAEIDKQNILIEKTNAEAEAKYQADVLAYNKEQTRVEDGRKQVNLTFDKKIEEYSKAQQESVNAARAREPEINIRMGTYSAAYKDDVNRAGQQYNTLTTFTNEQRQSALNQYEFKMAYPNVSLDQQTSQAFKSAGPKDSLIGIYEKYQGSYDAQAVRSRQNALQNAGLIHSGVQQTKAQSKIPYVNPVTQSKSPQYTPSMQKRVDAIKPTEIPKGTIFPFTPTLAQKQTGTLTNVNTGQYIDQYNKPQTNVVANPRALVAGLKRQVAPEGTPIREQPSPIIIGESQKVFTVNKKEYVGTPDVLAIVDLSQRGGGVKNKNLYLGTLQDKGIIPTPQGLELINTLSSKNIGSSPESRTSTYTNPKTGKTFNAKTGKGDLLIANQVGIFGTSFLGYDNSGKPVQGPLQTLFTVENVNAKTKGKYPTLTFKSEEQANKYLNRTAKSEPFTGLVGNDFFAKDEFVATKPSIVEQVTAPKPTSFNEFIEKNYNALGELEEINAKSSKSGNPFDLLAEAAYAPAQLVRVGLGVTTSVTNFGEQVANPILFKEAPYLFVSKPPTIPPKEIILKGDTADTTLIPVDFSEGITKVRYTPIEGKEYQDKQKKYIAKYGLISYVGGGSTLLIGVPGLVKSGAGIGIKSLKYLSTPGKQAVKNEIVMATSKGGAKNWDVKKGGIKTWDQLEKAQKVGFRQKATIPADKLEKNPFGKESRISYAVNQLTEKIKTRVQTAQTQGRKQLQTGLESAKNKGKQIIRDIKISAQTDGFLNPNKTLIRGNNAYIPNVTAPQRNFSKLNGLGISMNQKVKPFIKTMGTVFYPDQPVTTKINKYGRTAKTKDNLSISLYKTKQSIKDTWARMGAVYDTSGVIKPKIKKTKQKPNILSKAQADFNANLIKQKKKVNRFITKKKDVLDDKLSTVKNKLDVKQKLKNIKTQKQLSDYFAQQDKAKNLDVKKTKTTEIITPKSENELGNIGRKKGITTPISDYFRKAKFFDITNLVKRTPKNEQSIVKVKNESKIPTVRDLISQGNERMKGVNSWLNSKKINPQSAKQSDVKIVTGTQNKKGRIGLAKIKDIFKINVQKESSPIVKIKGGTSLGEFKNLVDQGYEKAGIFAEKRKDALRNIMKNKTKGKSTGILRGLNMKRQNIKNMFKNEGLVDRKDALRNINNDRTGILRGLKIQNIKNMFSEGEATQKTFTQARKENLKNLMKPVKSNQYRLPEMQSKSSQLNDALKNPKKTELENILGEFKNQKQKNTTERIEIGQQLPTPNKTLEIPFEIATDKKNKRLNFSLSDAAKSKYGVFGVGGAVVGVTVLSSQQEAAAFPMPTGVLRVVRSGGQELVFAERPQFKTIPTGLTKSILSSPQKSKEETEPKYKIKTLSKLGTMSLIIPKIIQSQPQKIKQTTRQILLSPQKLNVDVKPKQETKQKTKQKLVQTPRYVQVFALRQVPRLTQPQKLAQPLKLSAPLAPKQPQRLSQTPKLTPIPKIKLITRTRPPTKPPKMIIPFALPKEEKKRESPKSKSGEKADFLGNTSETQVAGMFNRAETTYGLRKIARLSRGDKRVERGGNRSVRRGTAKFVEGKKGDMFGFKYESKKRKTIKFF